MPAKWSSSLKAACPGMRSKGEGAVPPTACASRFGPAPVSICHFIHIVLHEVSFSPQ